ncbi:MAG: substrate-binding domain-containing protein [Psychromonas sp.]
MTPSLTTIHQAKFNLGRQAFDTLIDKIQSKRETNLEIQLDPVLVERDSVKTMW